MSIRRSLWLVIPLLVGLGAYSITSTKSAWKSIMRPRGEPSIRLPPPVQLGERELGENVLVRLSVSNDGESELIMDQIQATCTCIGLGREENGELVYFDSMRIQPGESVDFALRLTVKGVPGGHMHNAVLFRTNDPQLPQAAVETVVTKILGGVDASPSAVLFGTQRMSATAKAIVEIRDCAPSPSAVESVASSIPAAFSVRLLPGDEFLEQSDESGRLIGRVEVVLTLQRSEPMQASGAFLS